MSERTGVRIIREEHAEESRCANEKMKEKMWKCRNYILYGLIFLFFFSVFWYTPLVHDAWAGQTYNYYPDFIQWLLSRIQGYFFLNGRIIAQIFVGFFERNEVLLDVSNALFMTILIALIDLIFHVRKSCFTLMLFSLFLLASVYIRTEIYLYATMIYIIPVILFAGFLCFFIYFGKESPLSEKSRFFILCVIGILNSCWIEHSAFAFVLVTGVCWMVDFIKMRKINLPFTVFEGLNGIAFCIMAFSPGLRQQRSLSFDGPLSELVRANLGNTVQAVLYDHKMIFFILLFSCMILMRQKCEKRIGGILWQGAVGSYMGILLLNILYEKFPFEMPEYFIMDASVTCAYGGLWRVTGLLAVVLLIAPLLFHSKKNILLFSYFTGICSLIPTIVTPNFGHRICFFAVAIMILVTAGTIADLQLNGTRVKRFFQILFAFILFVQIDSYSILMANIHKIQQEREKRIELVKAEQAMGRWDFNKTLILPTFSGDQLYMGASPQPYYDQIHHQAFLDFYDLSCDTKVLFGDTADELRVLLENGMALFEVFPENEKQEYEFEYYIMRNGAVVWQSGKTTDKRMEAVIPNEAGTYYFLCNMSDGQGGVTQVFSAQIKTIE